MWRRDTLLATSKKRSEKKGGNKIKKEESKDGIDKKSRGRKKMSAVLAELRFEKVILITLSRVH